MVKDGRLVRINFNIVSLIVIQIALALFGFGCLQNQHVDELVAWMNIGILLFSISPSTIYFRKYKPKNLVLMLWQHIKLAFLLILAYLTISYEHPYLFIIIFAVSVLLVFTSLKMGMRKTCKACVIISALCGLTALFFSTEISTIWHLISFGVFASILVIGFAMVWKHISKEFGPVESKMVPDSVDAAQDNGAEEIK